MNFQSAYNLGDKLCFMHNNRIWYGTVSRIHMNYGSSDNRSEPEVSFEYYIPGFDGYGWIREHHLFSNVQDLLYFLEKESKKTWNFVKETQ